MSDPVTVIVWRDAKNDPPRGDMTRLVLVQYANGGSLGHRSAGLVASEHTLGLFASEHTLGLFAWWCDPTPPAADALTTDDLRYLADAAPSPQAERLRRAIKEATHE